MACVACPLELGEGGLMNPGLRDGETTKMLDAKLTRDAPSSARRPSRAA